MKNEVISTFKEKPKTKTAWWAMGLGLGTFLGGPLLMGIIFPSVIRPALDKASSENVGAPIGFNIGIISFILSIFALVTCVRAFKKGERSWVLWVGFVPAILAGAFWVYMIIGNFIFPQ